MTIKSEYEELLKKRMTIEGDVDFDNDPVIHQMVVLMTRNLAETIAFLDKECTADQFSWLSEIFDEIAEITGSREFIEALYRVAEKFPEETEKYNLRFFIDSAAEYTQ